MHSSASTIAVELSREFSIDLRIGWWRRTFAAVIAFAGCVAGWLWLGNSGAALLGLWAWSAWPRWETRRITVNPAKVRWARFTARRVLWTERPLHAQQVFADELDAPQFAALRRNLKRCGAR